MQKTFKSYFTFIFIKNRKLSFYLIYESYFIWIDKEEWTRKIFISNIIIPIVGFQIWMTHNTQRLRTEELYETILIIIMIKLYLYNTTSVKH